MRIRHWLQRATLVAGILGVSVWLGSIAESAVFQGWQNWVFDHQLRGQPADFNQFLAEGKERLVAFVARPNPVTAGIRSLLIAHAPASLIAHLPVVFGSPEPSPRVPANGGSLVGQALSPAKLQQPPTTRAQRDRSLIGRLTIPRLHVSAIVREGIGEKTLRVALGHIPGTALPGMSGNIAVAGHRDTLFRPLRQIRPNDLIRLESLDGTYVYRVEKTEIVGPRNVSVLRMGSRPELTLVTCYPFYYVGAAPKRFIVRARQVSANARTAAL